MKKLIAIVIGLTTIAAMSWFFPVVTQRSDCGGNSAALTQVCDIAVFARAHALDRPDGSFSFAHLSDDERAQLADCSVERWIKAAKFLVTTTAIRRSEPGQTIVAVCDTPFTNVPQQLIGRARPTYAVGYADGTTGLITEAEFRGLDRTKFIDVASLVSPPTN